MPDKQSKTPTLYDFDMAFAKILNMIFKECPDGMVYKDSNLHYKAANEAFYQCYDINDKTSFIDQKEAYFLSTENQKLVSNVSQSVLKEKKSISYIMSVTGKTDALLSVTSTPIFFRDDFLGIISIVKDITYEECVKQQFVTKHFQVKSLLENIPMIIYMQDKALNYISGTKPAQKFIEEGLDTVSNISVDYDDFCKIESYDNQYVISKNEFIIKEREITDTKQGRHWYKIYKIPIHDLTGNVNGIITLLNNIDAEKQLQAQRDTFVASLGHDLKNPTLAQIRGLELVLKGAFGDITDEQREILSMILDSCKYMNGMLASLLATYRNQSGMVKLNFEEISLIDIVNDCVSEMIYVAKDKNVKIILNNYTENSLIKVDSVQIKRVIMNLISNGIKYSFPNTDLVLRIQGDNHDNISFEFENKSPYISEEKRKGIFGQYVTYASAYNAPGIGLGLYASKKIIDAHSGKIYVNSFEDDRNIFGFEIPIKQSDNEERVVYF